MTISELTRALLDFSDKPGVGAAALRHRIETFGSHPPNGQDNTARADKFAAKKPKAIDILEACHRNEVTILSPLDADYPPLLRKIGDYPPFLYVKGNKRALTLSACAVVGTRKASVLGESWARQIAAVLAKDGFAVVSGLALGIDSAAHRGTLKHNGVTIAILAHGLDKITPTSNTELAEAILASGGTLASEHPPGVPPRRAEYVRRNRLQSGMTLCSIIVESGKEGGAIHQARFTREQGHDLFAVLPPRDTAGGNEFNWEGADFLIKSMRAKAISSRDDLLRYVASYPHALRERPDLATETQQRALPI